ncbi:MAG: hypothetical protein V1754_00485 [Pseudomonadota bacterium]
MPVVSFPIQVRMVITDVGCVVTRPAFDMPTGKIVRVGVVLGETAFVWITARVVDGFATVRTMSSVVIDWNWIAFVEWSRIVMDNQRKGICQSWSLDREITSREIELELTKKFCYSAVSGSPSQSQPKGELRA